MNQNKNLDTHCYIPGAIRVLENEENKDFAMDLKKKCSYSKKAAEKNIRAMSCCSEELLQALTDVLIESYPETHEYLKVFIYISFPVCKHILYFLHLCCFLHIP